jgi:hypothetical protein
VFDNGAKIVDAIKGGEKPLKAWGVQTLNTIQNVFTGATYTAISKAMLPEQSIVRADSFIEEVKNNLKQRNVIVRMFAGRPPSRIGIWGDPIKVDNSVGGVLGGILGFEKGNESIFGIELYNEAQKTGNSKFFPPFVSPSLSIEGKSVRLSAKEYDDLQMEIGRARKEFVEPFIYGKAMYDGKTYQQLTKEQDKIDALEALYDEGRKVGVIRFKAKPENQKYITEQEVKNAVKEQRADTRLKQKQMIGEIKNNR